MCPALVDRQPIDNVLKPREAKQRREAIAWEIVIQITENNPAAFRWVIPKALPNNLRHPHALQAAAMHGFVTVAGDALEVIYVNSKRSSTWQKDIHLEAIPPKHRLPGTVGPLIPLV